MLLIIIVIGIFDFNIIPFISSSIKWLNIVFHSIFGQFLIIYRIDLHFSVHFSSVTQSCPNLWDPMNHSTPGLTVHHQLPESTQTHVPWVSDAIQPSHALSSPSPPAQIPPSIRVFSNESTLHMRWPKYWSFSFGISPSNEHPGQISWII